MVPVLKFLDVILDNWGFNNWGHKDSYLPI